MEYKINCRLIITAHVYNMLLLNEMFSNHNNTCIKILKYVTSNYPELVAIIFNDHGVVC